jgi:signal transduction histidine kinase
MAIERAELFEQMLASARHSSMLYRVAARVQSSLDSQTIIQMTVSSLMEAVPIQSCEVYTFGEDGRLTRREHAVATTSQDAGILLGPEIMDVDEPVVVEALQSNGPVMAGTVRGLDDAPRNVLMGRLMGSQDVIGLVRFTTNLPVEEFVHRHAIFCQTLFTHAGGALERSRLYATVVAQAEMLRTRARQLTDILHLGNISAADEPLLPVLPQIASGIAHSLGFAYVRIGDIGPGSSNAEVWASADEDWSGISGLTTKPLSLDSLERLLVAGAVHDGEATPASPARPAFRSAILDEALLARLVPGQPVPRPDVPPRRLILMLLESSSGGTLGYIIAALKPQAAPLPAPMPVPVPPAGNSPDSTAVVRPSSEGDLLELLGIFAQKISLLIENHRIYSQLLDSKRKIDAVVLSISDGVIVTDAELNVMISNALADSLLGVPSTESHGQSLARFIRHDALLAMLRDCIATSRPVSMDVELELGGETRTYEAVAYAISAPAPDMHVLGAVLTMRDVTLARATERAKSDFLSMVSHELRTPLNSVLGFLDITLMGKTGQLTDLQADFLSTARQEAQVLQRLINDLLDYSQLQSGMLRMEMAPVNLSSLIARVVNQARPLAQEDHLKIINNVPPGLIVRGDEVRLEQVFKNLLDNAAKFTDAYGQIVFSSRRKGSTVTISVTDNGPGIPPSQLKEVFERFFQGDNSPRRHRRGLGLGLAICKNIVEAHGGHIWIESEPGKGTTVFVELPLFDPEDGDRTQQVLTGRAGAMVKNPSD